MSISIISADAQQKNKQQCKLAYPVTREDNTTDVYFGVKVADPYRWLEDDNSAETAAWVTAQNKLTFSYMEKIPFRSALHKRLEEVANYGKVGAPSYHNGKWYFSKNDGLQNQSVIYVMDKLGGEARVFLDPNKLSDDGTVALQDISFSRDGKYTAYVISRSGSDWNEIYVMETATGKLMNDHITWAKFTGATWAGDGFYYSRYDKPAEAQVRSGINENHKVYYHKMGTAQSEDKLFYMNESKPMLFYYAYTDSDQNFLFMRVDGADAGNALYIKDLRGASSGCSSDGSGIVPMAADMRYSYNVAEVVGDKIFISTNHNAPKGKVMVADANNPGIENWKELVPESQNVLSGVQIIDGKLFLTYDKDAANHVYVYTLEGKEINEIKLPSLGSAGFSGRKDRKECFFAFTSFTVPGAIYRYDVEKNESTLYSSPKLNFNPDDFATEQIFFKSKDGTRIPMFLTYKKGMKRNGKNPVVIYGYGGFNISLNPAFSFTYIPFLEKGGIYVSVNLRGGNEYGEEWHKAGTKMEKQNVFDDFIAAAEYLDREKYTDPEHTAIMGASNGGLLVGACMDQRPDLYKVVIARVGVMDMLRYHKFTIGWNWAPDYGTSADSKEMFEYLKSYSPLHNLKEGVKYPATLVMTADHDDRVVPAHSFKFAATLQKCNGGDNPTIIRIDSKAGHGGGKPMSKVLDEQADIYSFVFYNLGMK